MGGPRGVPRGTRGCDEGRIGGSESGCVWAGGFEYTVSEIVLGQRCVLPNPAVPRETYRPTLPDPDRYWRS